MNWFDVVTRVSSLGMWLSSCIAFHVLEKLTTYRALHMSRRLRFNVEVAREMFRTPLNCTMSRLEASPTQTKIAPCYNGKIHMSQRTWMTSKLDAVQSAI